MQGASHSGIYALGVVYALKSLLQVLLSKGAKVYIAARNKTKAEEAIEWLKNETGGKTANFIQLDLASLDSIRKAAAEYRE